MNREWLRLLRYAHPSLGEALTLLMLVLVGVGLESLKPWPLKLIVDHVLSGQPLPDVAQRLVGDAGAVLPGALLGGLALAMVLLFVAGQAVHALQVFLQSGVGTRLVYRLGGVLFDHLQRLSLSFHHRHRAGDLVRRVTIDSSCVRDLLLGVGLTAVTAAFSLGTMFTIMWQLDRSMALLALLVAPLLGVLIRIFDRPMTERTYRQIQLEGEMMALAEQTLTALPVVQAFSREEHEDLRFRRLSQRTLHAHLHAILSQMQFNFGVGGATAFGMAAMMALGGYRVLSGDLTVGTLLVFLSYLASLYAPMEALAYLTTTYTAAKASARRVLEVLNRNGEVADRSDARPFVRDAGRGGIEVRFQNVTFGYETGRPVLHDIDLTVQAGETVALVGTTGAGKTTLTALIPRFFDPWQGRVLFDNVDVRDIQLQSIRKQVALVLQEPFLLPITVADNIAYGRPGASRNEIIAAAVAANADEFIRGLPHGYDTVIGERGATLSGGQRQRLAIARAVLKDAPILLLDEPTAALDAQTEALVMEAIVRLTQDRTTFIIAHRLSTVRVADRIVVLVAGRVAECGTHDELIVRPSAYRRLHALQFLPSQPGSLGEAG